MLDYFWGFCWLVVFFFLFYICSELFGFLMHLEILLEQTSLS